MGWGTGKGEQAPTPTQAEKLPEAADAKTYSNFKRLKTWVWNSWIAPGTFWALNDSDGER